jgi:hypothetical protein
MLEFMWHRVPDTGRQVTGHRVMGLRVQRTDQRVLSHRRLHMEHRAMCPRDPITRLLCFTGLQGQHAPHHQSTSSETEPTHPLMRQNTCRGHPPRYPITAAVVASSISATVGGNIAIEAASVRFPGPQSISGLLMFIGVHQCRGRRRGRHHECRIDDRTSARIEV